MSNRNFSARCFILIVFISISFLKPVFPQEIENTFFSEGTVNKDIPTPEETFDFATGDQPAGYDKVIEYLKLLSEKSPRVRMFESGKTFEGRKLYYLLISSEENINSIEEIQKYISQLADPRKLKSQNDADKIINSVPAIAWMMYSVHGDELSGVDASVAAAYRLAACNDKETLNILKNVVTGIIPSQNPDGRERYLSQQFSWKSEVQNNDQQSIQHTGSWPWGRTNHYFFDMNRDWFILSQPETQARVKSLLEWNPQLVIDAHEQGRNSSYFFNPPREPINPIVNKDIKKWWKVFAADQAKAFDNFGWSYFTRENYEDWYPGYGNGLPYYMSAVGILYEQSRTDGYTLKKSDGTTLTYKESVHHQYVSTIANLNTLANNRKDVLSDYYSMKKEALTKKPDGVSAYIIDPIKNPSRAKQLIDRLLMLGIEVQMSETDFKAENLRGYWDTKPVTKIIPKGSYIISTSQPLSPLLNVILEFDPRMSTEFLKSERESLEKGKGTRFYDASAWSMLLGYGVDAYTISTLPSVKTGKIEKTVLAAGEVINPDPKYGFVINFTDDNSVKALAEILNKNLKVAVAEKPFKVENNSFPAGSLLLRLNENPANLKDEMESVSKKYSIKIFGVSTALAQDGPDLGGNEFELLDLPKIAILTGQSIDLTDFGSLWFMMDQELKFPYTIINSAYFNRTDLRKYNVLLMPSGSYKDIFSKSEISKLKNWVSGGGTLIAIENAAVFLSDSSTGVSKVKLKRESLKKLNEYEEALESEKNIGNYKIDSLDFWAGKDIEKEKTEKSKAPDYSEIVKEDLKGRLFKPEGAILRLDLDNENWMTFGLTDKIPAIIYSSYAFLAKDPVEVSARFAEPNDIRLSGLLWPEARKRWSNTAYATRESSGNGQIILFSASPSWRSYFYETERLLINSMLLGPGMGTRQPVSN